MHRSGSEPALLAAPKVMYSSTKLPMGRAGVLQLSAAAAPFGGQALLIH